MRTAIPAEAFDHGDPKRYRRGCRCTKCTKAASAEGRKNLYLRQTGRGSQCATERAARHIHLLRAANLSDAEIQNRANTHPDVMYRILRGEGTIHRDTERRILAVAIPTNPEGKAGARISGLGTRRRLRILAAEGWPAAELGRRCNRHKKYISYLQGDHGSDLIRIWVARDIADLYTTLRDLRPEEAGVPPYIAERARQRAASNDWLGTAYWDDDDLDNPEFDPRKPLKRDELAALRRDEILHLARYGYEPEAIRQRLNGEVSLGTVRDIVREHRTGRKRDRTKAAA